MSDLTLATINLSDPTNIEPDERRPDTAPSSCDDDSPGFSGLAADWNCQNASVTWPPHMLPVEIFEIITSHLSRFEVRCLRLVCREFEAKVSAQYFRNVVVPFKSELYNNLGRDGNGALKRTSSTLLSNGMRIFQSFGRHIWRFALSLELDEDTLSYPPIKPSQEAIPAFWGVYRWPHGTYHRYTDLEGLEQTADETEAMKEALKCLVKVTNLGLCCDAGLGFLSGPDHIARSATTLHPVFATQNWRRAGFEPDQRKQPIVTMSDFNDCINPKKPVFENPISFKRTVLQKMVSDAGYRGAQMNEAMHMILETEGTSLTTIDFDERASLLNDIEARRSLSQSSILADFEPSVDAMNYPLIPSSLTRAQKEMLLELEWAHRAMIQSYVIGLIDNAREGCFTNLTTLTIAKIPSSHVYIFYRDELWQNIPTLNNVSLGVIADWRRVSKPAPGCVEDTAVSPVEAVGKVYQLLNSYIGAQPNIESLHFEWICGGEFAPGTHQRNHYVLPAPFFQQPELMAAADSPITHADEALSLPFIKHLSLKNCWASPHVFLHTMHNMALSSLEKLELESVSLSGQPTTTPQAPLQQAMGPPNANAAANLLNLFQLGNQQPAPNAQHLGQQLDQQPPPLAQLAPVPVPTLGQLVQLAQQHAQNNQQGPPPNLLPQLNNLVPDSSPMSSEILQQPEWLSWAGIIEHLSPSIKIRDILARTESLSEEENQWPWPDQPNSLTQYIPGVHSLRSDEKKYTIKCLSFKSCGYVCVDAPFLNTRGILPHGAQGLSGNGNPHNQDLSPLMQRSRDKMLGRIAPHIRSQELFQLVNAFGMDMGWEGIYDNKTISDAVADGVEHPGRYRFSGTVDAGSAEDADPNDDEDMGNDEVMDHDNYILEDEYVFQGAGMFGVLYHAGGQDMGGADEDADVDTL
ncbi:f-box containing [Fusarium albosuccineum]|uniref:F-box containing n=1 Tax=Fusarium albosuccineum TaxID=1237068 RepID=A0A8H4PFX4_9HYPO|nr:f-box containing [Fusarium albosuccineum]